MQNIQQVKKMLYKKIQAQLYVF